MNDVIFQVLYNLILTVKDKFINKTDWQKESLKSDFIVIFNEFLEELKEIAPKWEPPKEVKILIWEQYKILQDADIEKDWLEYKEWNMLEFWFENYLKDWDYRKVFWEAKIKLLSYFNAIKNCIKNYWDDKYYPSLRKERKLLNEFVEKNLKSLKEAFVDFMISIISPNLSKNDRKYVIYEIVDKLNIEAYLPIFNKFFDKIDTRLICE